MAEQFVLKGVKELRDYSYTSSPTFIVKNNPRGGDTWKLPQWFAKKGNNTQYIECTVLDLVNTNYLAIIPTSPDTQLMVSYDGDVYDIRLSNFVSVDRVAITTKDTKRIVVEYLLPRISGGAVAKRILQTQGSIGDFAISGVTPVDVGESAVYDSNATPSVNDAVFAWTVEQSGSTVASSVAEVTSGATASSCTVAWKAAGTYDVKCAITSNDASDSPKSELFSVTCNTVKTVGTVTVSGPSSTEAQKLVTYSSSISGNNVNDLDYKWTVLNGAAQIANPTASSTGITFSSAGNATVQCVVSSASTSDNTSDTAEVVVTTAKQIGNSYISGVANTPVLTATNYQVNSPDSNISNASYVWSVAPSAGVVITASTAQATNITFPSATAYTVKCTVSSTTANDTPQIATPINVTANANKTIGNVNITGPNPVVGLNVGKNYSASNSGDAAGMTYVWTSAPTTGCTINNSTTASPQVVYTAAGDYTLTCTISSGDATDTPQAGTKNVTVTTS